MHTEIPKYVPPGHRRAQTSKFMSHSLPHPQVPDLYRNLPSGHLWISSRPIELNMPIIEFLADIPQICSSSSLVFLVNGTVMQRSVQSKNQRLILEIFPPLILYIQWIKETCPFNSPNISQIHSFLSFFLACPSLNSAMNYDGSLLSTLPGQLLFPPIHFFFPWWDLQKTEIEPHHLKVF